jgi:tRNA-specific 2-thiouridylase
MTHDGQVIGQHSGLVDYTIGQRKGLAVQSPEPLYVIGTDLEKNALIVGPLDALGSRELTATRVNWVSGSPPDAPIHAQVKIRYKARPMNATVTTLSATRVHVQFDENLRDITPGQGAVFYDGDLCLGGGIIERRSAITPDEHPADSGHTSVLFDGHTV